MECPDCGGKGALPPVPDEKRPYMASFPKLCDRCSGFGEIKPPPPPKED